MMRRALLLLAAVVLAQYGYRWFADIVDHRWAFYVGRGIEGAVACWLLIRPRPWDSPLAALTGMFAACLGMLEEAQTSVCGVAEWGANTSSSLCVAWLGGDTLAAIAAIAVASVLVYFRKDSS